MTATSGQVEVPDIGDFDDVPVIEILVAVGDTVSAEDPLVTLESDKATMDVPAPFGGTVKEITASVGDQVSQGSALMVIEGDDGESAPSDAGQSAPAEETASSQSEQAESSEREPEPTHEDEPEPTDEREPEPTDEPEPEPTDEREPQPTDKREAPSAAQTAGNGGGPIYASPSARRLARELGVELRAASGSGRGGRITREDVKRLADGDGASAAPAAADREATASGGGALSGLEMLPWPTVDFEKFGPVERVTRSRIQRISAPNLARNWVMIPHVTHHDEADITELEAWRKRLNEQHGSEGIKFTMVSFLVTACVAALKAFPDFNSSLDGDELVLKRYYNIGFAADTPGGLLVPVIKDAEGKGLKEIAGELSDLSGRAREGKLKAEEMSGATFTISSLGGIGGTGFTPIINAPEVAILGVTRAATKPVWDARAETFAPRLMVPLSLSYDHRVIDGAAAARFTAHLVDVLSDLRRALL